MRTLDTYIADIVTNAVNAAVKPLVRELAEVRRELTELKEVKNDYNTYDQKERLISKVEARRRLGVTYKNFVKLTEAGLILVADCPNGRGKVIESSLNKYVQSLQVAKG